MGLTRLHAHNTAAVGGGRVQRASPQPCSPMLCSRWWERAEGGSPGPRRLVRGAQPCLWGALIRGEVTRGAWRWMILLSPDGQMDAEEGSVIWSQTPLDPRLARAVLGKPAACPSGLARGEDTGTAVSSVLGVTPGSGRGLIALSLTRDAHLLTPPNLHN